MKTDKLGPREHQSPTYKKHPSNGGNPQLSDSEVEHNLIGGNKHSSSGGGTDEHTGSNECVRSARKNYGIDSYPGHNPDNFEE